MNGETSSLKKEDEIFCPECGKPIKKNAVVCPNCGVQVKELAVSIPKSITIEETVTPKSKGVAILLAIFLGIWTWLYTYKKDLVKFWVSLGVILITLISLSIETSGWSFLIGIPFAIWAIVDVAKRPETFYTNYPKG